MHAAPIPRPILVRSWGLCWISCGLSVRCGASCTAGVEVARHRRQLVDGPPVELLVFRGDDWISDGDMPPFEAWLKARFEWAKAHPDDFSLGGDVLDMLRARAAYKRGL
jgi:hypothetical protein